MPVYGTAKSMKTICRPTSHWLACQHCQETLSRVFNPWTKINSWKNLIEKLKATKLGDLSNMMQLIIRALCSLNKLFQCANGRSSGRSAYSIFLWREIDAWKPNFRKPIFGCIFSFQWNFFLSTHEPEMWHVRNLAWPIKRSVWFHFLFYRGFRFGILPDYWLGWRRFACQFFKLETSKFKVGKFIGSPIF